MISSCCLDDHGALEHYTYLALLDKFVIAQWCTKDFDGNEGLSQRRVRAYACKGIRC